MNQKQTLTEYVVKEINHHLEMTGKSMSLFAKECNMNSNSLLAFTNGIGSITLKTADKLLTVINK